MNSRKFPYFAKINKIALNLAILFFIAGQTKACPSPTTSFPITEDFEANSFANWTHDSTDDFDWRTHTGSTTSGSTGPSGAYNGSFYAYTEATTPNNPSKVSNLISPCFSVQSGYTTDLAFAYHMYGAGMGSFNVDITTNDGTSWTNLWGLTGNQGDVWNTLSVNLDAYAGQDVKLRFNVVTGTYQSDVSIDDVVISSVSTDCNAVDISSLDGSTDAITDFNNANVMIGDAVVTIEPTTYYGTATLDEYGINDNHETGSFGLQLGVNSTGPSNYLESIYNFSKGVEFYNGRILDIDYSDAIRIYGKLNGQDVPFTITNLGSCVNFDGNNTFNSTCFSNGSPVNSTLYSFDISFDGVIDQIIFQSYDPGPGDGGSFTFVISPDPSCSVDLEICGNGTDDDGDLAVDEDDPDCYSCTDGLLTNPDFQSDLTGWTDWGFTTITTESNGNKYASITGGAGGFGQDEAAVEGDVITLTFQAKKLNSSQSSVGFAIYDASWTKITSDQAVAITSDNFQKYTVTYTLPANTAWVQPFGWKNDAAGELHIDGFCLTKTSSPSSDCNMALNPEFVFGTSDWTLQNTSTAAGSFTIDNTSQLSGTNSAFINITNSTGTNWHSQFKSGLYSIESSKLYYISFEAKAAASKIINVSLQQQGSPNATYYYSPDITISTTAETYTFPAVNVTNTASDAQLKFYLGNDNSDIWIDNIVFKEADCLAQGECEACIGDNLFANPGFESGSFIGADVFITGVNSDNLGSNWGTPSGLDGWSHGPMYWVETTQAVEGNKVVYLNNDSGGAVCQGQYYDLGDDFGQISTCGSYRLCFAWASFNRSFPTGRSVTSQPALDITWFDINDVDLGVSHVDLGTPTANQDWSNLTWSSVTYEFSLIGGLLPPANATSVRINISEAGGQDNGILVDNTSLCVTSPCFSEVDDEKCYFISDGFDNGSDTPDTLYTFNYITSTVTPIGPTGTFKIESMAMDTVSKKVYAVSGDEFGLIDVSSGQFYHISYEIGDVNGAEGIIDIDDIDGMTYDHTNNIIWATERRTVSNDVDGLPDDLLIQIDPATGLAIQNAFGSGVDYLVINTPENDLDDIALADDGTLYAISNFGGSGNQAFGSINKTTGAWTDLGDYGVEDVESLSFTATGQLVATTGKDGDHSNQLYTIDAGTGIATFVGSVLPGNDVEACDCISAKLINLQIGDKVFADIDGDGLQDLEEPGVENVTVNLLTSSGSPYLDKLGAPTTTTTDAFGIYIFDGLPEGQFIVEFVNPGGGASFTSLNAGGDDTVDSDANTSTGRSHIITLSGSTNDMTIDAGLLNANVAVRDCDDVGDLFVADEGGVIKRYNPTTGLFIDDFIKGLTEPVEMVVGSDDWLYVSNSGEDEINKYSLVTGVLIETLDDSALNDPHGLTEGPDGNIYINNDDTDEVLKLEVSSGIISVFVTSTAGGLNGNKWGIEFGPDGNLYVASFYTDEVLRYNGTSGAFMDVFVTANTSYVNAPSDLKFGPDGHLYVAGKYNDKVVKYNGTTGAYMSDFVTYQSGGLQDPVQLNFGDDGFLYVSSQSTTIGVLKFNGTTGAFIENFAPAPIPAGILFAPVPKCGDCPQIDVIGSNIICEGGSIVLTSTVSGGLGVCGYQWESSSDTVTWTPISGATGNVLSIVSQTTDTYYRLEYSCSGNVACLQAYSDPHLVVVNPDLTVGISYSGTLCLEDDTQLTADVAGGTPIYQYSWTGPNTFSSTLQTITVPESGNYNVTVTDAAGCTAEFSAFVYDAYEPFIFALNTTVCEGESVTLSINSATAVSYQWGANAGNATSSSVTVTPSPPSTDYVVTVTNNQGCQEVATATINVTARPVVTVTGPSPICVGETTTLSPTTGGNWVSTNSAIATVSPSGVVTGVSAGTVNFIFTNSTTGCESLPSTDITVLAKTSVSVSGPTSICEGFTSQLSPTSGGTWSSNNTSIATVTNGGVVTGVSEGSTTFVFTNSTTGCASDATQPITVNDIPTVAVTGSTTICVGSTTSLTPMSGGTWTSSNSAVASVSNLGIVTALSEGTATFTFTTSQGCVSAPTETVTVDPAGNITISGDNILCEGETSQLSASSGGGTWISGNTSLATINSSGLVTSIAAGSVTITYQHNSASCAADPTFGIQILDLPTVSISGATSICVGDNTQLSTTGSGGFWTSSDSNIAIVSSTGVVAGIAAGTVSFAYTSSNGCESNATGTITVDPEVDVSVDFNGSQCLQDDSQLSAIATGGSGGNMYSWTGPGGFSSTLQTIDIVLNGNYNLTVTDSKGCSSSTTAFVYEAYEPFVFALNTEVCEGEDVTLSVNSTSAATYQWGANAGNATTQSVTVTPGVPSTSYSVTVTNSIGCTTEATAVIDVDPKPIVTITGSNTICENETTQLTPSTGGTWQSSDYSVATITNTGLVTGVSNGTATFTFRSDATDCYSDPSAPVTVSDNGVVTITGDNQICIGESPTLVPSITGGTWSSSNIGVAQVNSSGVITANSQGSATITYTPPTSNCYSDATYEINVHNTPNLSINGPSTICENENTYLSASTSGVWTSSDPTVASVSATGIVTGMSAGTATFSFVSSAGCPSTLGTPVTVIGSPVVSLNGPGDICVNSTTSLLPNTGGVWISSNTNVATVNSTGVVTGVNPGIATFTFIEYTNGCISDDMISINVNSDPTINGLDENNLCIGEVTFITPSSGGTWASSNTAVATITNGGVITATGAGSATFTFMNTLTGCTSNASMPLTVNSNPVTNFTGPTSLCVGETTSIAPASGGTWASSNVSIATITSGGIITGVSPGTVQFIYTNNITGCTSDPSEDLSVDDPTDINVTGPSVICVGASTTLSPTTGGTWESSNVNIATVTNNGIVTGIAPGSATFTFNSNTGCTSDPSTSITIDPQPVLNYTGPSSICIGTTTTLSPSSGGSWTSSNTAVATVTNGGLVTGVSAGSATFTFVDSTTGCSATTQTSLNVFGNPTISISGDDEICIGSSTNMLPASGGSWVSSNSAVASISTSGVVTGMSAGTVTFTFYESGTGCVSAASDPITILPKPTVNITGNNPICAGETTTLSPTMGGSWISSNESVATVTDQGVVTGLTQGLVRFTFVSNEGCSSSQTAPVIVYGKPSIVLSGSNLLCSDDMGQMLPSTGGTWSSTNTSVATINNSGVFTAISAGTVRFIFTDTNTGCVSDESDEITINDKPTISITGPSNICIGGTTNLVPTAGGVWTSLNTTVATIQNNGEVLGVSAGSTRFLFTNVSTGCVSDTSAYITVEAGPIINFTGPQEICIGETTSISPTTDGTWVSTDNSVATIDNNGTITAVGQGSVRFRYTETSTGCISDLSETLTVHGNPTVLVSGPSEICIGGATTLSPSMGGSWTSLQPAIATVDQMGNVSGVSIGVAHFVFVDNVTGCASDGTLSVTIQDQVDVEITGDSEICLGYTTTLSPSSGGYWTSSNTAIATVSNSGIVTGRAPGVVTFEFTDGITGCTANGPTDPVTVELCTNHDFNVTLVDLEIQGNINTNDNIPVGTTYGGSYTTIVKPASSLPTLTVNSDGTYTFISNKDGKYVYSVPVCIPPLVNGCPRTYLEINVVDNIYSQSNPVANLEFVTTYTNANSLLPGTTVNINTTSNDDCLYSGGCDLDPTSVIVTGGATDGSTSVNGAGVIAYTPDAGFIGKDTIYYAICVDGEPTNCNTSYQIVTINDNSAVNSTVAADDFSYTLKETAVSGNVMSNDSDPEGDVISVTPQGSVGSPISIAEGTYHIESDGDFTFTPAAEFSGAVDIIYTLCDNATEPKCTQATLHLLVFNDISIKLRVYLEGALMSNGGEFSSLTGYPLMRDDLRVSPFTGENYIPASDPYTFQHDDFMNTPSMFVKMGPGLLSKNTTIVDSAGVFSVSGDNAVVDWVHVELRSKDDYTVPIATRSGLVQRDGDVVDLDGITDLRFDGVNMDSFYVIVKHRSHLGVMSMKVENDQLVDFTDPNFPVFNFGTTLNNTFDFTGLSQKANIVFGYNALWAGDFDSNGQVKFTNPADDVNILFVDVLFTSPEFLINYNNAVGYYTGDYNMNSKAKYTNPDDDVNFLFSQILLYPLNTGFLSNFNALIEQIPE